MLIPLSWLKDYVDVKLPLKELMWRLTEAGLTCESYKKVGDETILDVEVTANRPDWMSVIGVAREAAAIQGLKVKIKEPKELSKPKKVLPIKLNTDFSLFERWCGVVISGVEVKESPKWLKERIVAMNGRPINNIVDITNFVMYEYGIPMHAFDYDEIKGSVMTVKRSKGGENFTSVDGISYKLPKDAMVIYDSERLIDLAGIKGGLNSGIKDSTKNVFLHVTIDNPVLTRRSSIALGLRSEASAIYERGPDKGGALNVLKRATELITDLTGGEVASNLIDLKKSPFEPWNLEVTFKKLNKVLGIEIETKKVIEILEKLNLSPKKNKTGITCIVPTYRGDIKIEEDLIEEVARIYGYNKFPKTIPAGQVAKAKIPYYFDDTFNMMLKSLMTASGFSEVMTLSLISEDLIYQNNETAKDYIKISNPVSSDYEYLRRSLVPSLLPALKLNQEEVVKMFELDKVYLGTPEKPVEVYKLSAISKGQSFRELKGILDLILERLNIHKIKIEFESSEGFWHPSKSGTIKINNQTVGSFGEIHPSTIEALNLPEDTLAFELDVKTLLENIGDVIFKSVSENPPQIEDLTLSLPAKTKLGDVVQLIKSTNELIQKVELIDTYQDSYSLRIWYQHSEKTLNDNEVKSAREGILKILKSKFGASIK
ncbi:MAG: phenylalanine--tRNA ligase subunit beta [Microgenomates group bacterium]